MKKNIIIFLLLCITILFVFSYAGGFNNLTPSPSVGIRGYITSINKYKDTTTILVEGQIENDTLVDKANINVTSKTKVLKNNTAYSMNDLAIGQKVEVTFDGPVLESYPYQGTADIVKIISN